MLDRRLLVEQSGLRITHDFEDAFLEWEGGAIHLCDHYGDPQCALISPEQGWCMVGGEGLDVFRLHGSAAGSLQLAGHAELWRRGSPPPDNGRCWFVADLKLIAGDRVSVVAEAAGSTRTLEIDVEALAWRAVSAAPPADTAARPTTAPRPNG